LRRADENTRNILASLVASLGMEAEVIFDDRETNILRPSPLPTMEPYPDGEIEANPQPALSEKA
jgi:hypothetical protein